MPTYEYRCTQCARHNEVQQSFTDPPVEKCESCGGKLRRIFSPVGVMFKGSGFYSTDARSDARAQARKSEGQSANGEKGPDKSKTGSETKESGAADGRAASGQDKSASGKNKRASGDGKGASGESRTSGEGSQGAKRPAADKKS